MKYLTTLTAVFAAGSLFAQAPLITGGETSDKSQRATTGSDKHFIKEAAHGHYAEIALGQLALQKSQNQQVKDFAQKLVQDHTLANQQLKTVAQNQGVEFPKETDRKHQHHMDKLQKLSGAEFDQEFAKHMIGDHAKDVELYNKLSQKTQDQALKQYAENTLPKLQQHLESARSVGTAVGLSADTISSLEKRYSEGMGAPGGDSDAEKGGWFKKDHKDKEHQDHDLRK